MTTQSHSSYWLDDSGWDEAETAVVDDTNSIDRLVRLASVRRGIGNFVRILTNDPEITVRFSSGKTSYTDGKSVVIAADDNPKNFDVMVGLALHEGSHCLLTDFGFLQTIFRHDKHTIHGVKELTLYSSIHPELRKILAFSPTPEKFSYNRDMMAAVAGVLQRIMNVIEDRRIDSFVYKNATGYRPYYNSMYEKYFLNSYVEKNMRHNPEWREVTVENYLNWLIQMISPAFDPDALPGLRKMVNMIDMPNIRRFDEAKMSALIDWKTVGTMSTVFYSDGVGLGHGLPIYEYDQFPLLFRVANEILIEILKSVKIAQLKGMGNGKLQIDGLELDGEFHISEQEMEDFDSLPNLDLPQKRFNAEQAKRAMDKMKQVMDGLLRKKRLKKNEQEQINTMESADAKMTEEGDPVFGKIPCLVTKKLTPEIVKSDWFPFTRSWTGHDNYLRSELNDAYRGLVRGIRMGQVLAHRLAVRNDPTITHFTRQPHGKIDRRILAQLGMDIENVFKRTTVDTYKPALLHLSLDASGSMYGKKWERVIAVATALAYAADKISNLDVQISLRGDTHSDTPIVAVAYDSRRDSFAKARTLFPMLQPGGSTPEGLCYPATLNLIRPNADTHRVYFINFSDGEPGCHYKMYGRRDSKYYGGEEAHKQTKRAVEEMRELDIRILSYFITDAGYGIVSSKKAFTRMYGQNAEFVDVSNVTSVVKTINKLLLNKE